MMWASCVSAVGLVVVTLSGCGSSGLDLFTYDGSDVDRVKNPDRALVATKILDVTGAADTQVNGVYRRTKAGDAWKSRETGAHVRLGTFGAGQSWCCPANTHVWWMGYGGHGRYFTCVAGSVPPLSGWQARNEPGFGWSKQFGSGSAPEVEHQDSVPKYLEVTAAADAIVNGVFRRSQGGVWKNQATGARISVINFGAGTAWSCPANTVVWWMRDTTTAKQHKYFNCATTGSLPPLSGWQARNQGGFEWSADYADKSVPELKYLYSNPNANR